jgi:hypothetical protein
MKHVLQKVEMFIHIVYIVVWCKRKINIFWGGRGCGVGVWFGSVWNGRSFTKLLSAASFYSYAELIILLPAIVWGAAVEMLSRTMFVLVFLLLCVGWHCNHISATNSKKEEAHHPHSPSKGTSLQSYTLGATRMSCSSKQNKKHTCGGMRSRWRSQRRAMHGHGP